jgi:hypothetical protein
LEKSEGTNIVIPLYTSSWSLQAVIDDAKLYEMHAVFVDIAVNSGYSPK